MSETPFEIQLRGLSRRFHEGERKHIVLDAVDLDIRRGETVALRGRSGSGKSTLLNLIGRYRQLNVQYSIIRWMNT
jgi:ABC-type lipoprotein export system ATPase subunit